MKRFMHSVSIGVFFGILCWILNSLMYGVDYATTTPIFADNAKIIRRFDHTFDPLAYGLLFWILRVGLTWKMPSQGERELFRDSFASMCLTVPAFVGLLATFIVGARWSWIVLLVMLAAFGVVGAVVYILCSLFDFGKRMGSN